MLILNQLKLAVPVENEPEEIRRHLLRKLSIKENQIKEIRILKKSLDARRKPELYYSYQVAFEVDGDKTRQRLLRSGKVSWYEPAVYHFPVEKFIAPGRKRPVIIGTGPAGLFCGYFLSLCGLRPILVERGLPVRERQKAVEDFWENQILLPDCNVQFGEGGAGTFSDGKLQTQVKDKTGRIRKILEVFVENGAPEEILYLSKPHIGTDLLADVIENMHRKMEDCGAEFSFQTTFLRPHVENGRLAGVVLMDGDGKESVLETDACILCIGHSARDTFWKLHESGLEMENKPFAVGFRVQHRQADINLSQYGTGYGEKNLPAADYKLTCQLAKRNIYSFCMCPGGYVVNASSEEGRLAVNGMSYHGRDSENANSAIVMSVTQEDYGKDLFDGMRFQQRLEENAYRAAGGRIPVERYGDFKKDVEGGQRSQADAGCERTSSGTGGGNAAPACELSDASTTSGTGGGNDVQDAGEVCTADHQVSAGTVGSACASGGGFKDIAAVCKGAWQPADLSGILPEDMNRDFIEGMGYFGKLIEGFDADDVILAGIESRTSSPVRMLRDGNMESNIRGLYPCGEGAGYAGGITSAALDGLKVAEKIAVWYNQSENK